MSGTLQDEVDLIALPQRTVIAGPSWNDEVYLKADTDAWYSIGSDAAWSCRALSHRGPFTILRFGEGNA